MGRYARDPVSGNMTRVDSGGGISADNFIGTKQQWEALTPQEQAKYNTMDFFGDEGGGGSGGHTILNESGTEMSQRSKLQFEGAIVSDDETNDATVIETVNPVEYEEDIETLQNQITDQTNVLGTKNLLEITASTQTKNGVTLTVNRDSKGNVESIVVSGTPTAVSDFILNTDVRDAIAQGDGFILTGCPSGGANSTYGLALDPASDKASKYDTGSGVQFDSNYFNYSEDGAIAAKIHIGSAQVGNEINKTFYPMLRLASDPDNTYVPYAMTNREITEKMAVIADLVYPVGSIYMSVNSTSPATLFGGTWEQLKDQFLLGAGDTYTAGDTGGEAEHTLTVDEMPSHTHTVSVLQSGGTAGSYASSQYTFYPVDRNYSRSTLTSSGVGGDQNHNNMPPYLVVYMWKRTA